MNSVNAADLAASNTSLNFTSISFLKWSARAWFATAFVGQWIFAYYIATFFLPILHTKGFAGLGETHLPHGYVSGDLVGNLAIASHLVIASIIMAGGTVQLIPWVRNHYPTFHRYLGRTYVSLAVMASLAGLYLVWTRGVIGGMVAHVGVSLDAVLIIAFAIIAVRYAMLKNFTLHRRWALRLFMVVSAVWFYRIGLMGWLGLTGGVGMSMETFTGPFLSFLQFGQMFVPLLFLEMYFRASVSGKAAFHYVAGILILFAAAFTAFGTGIATVGMWFAR